jgi:hypothetical protein
VLRTRSCLPPGILELSHCGPVCPHLDALFVLRVLFGGEGGLKSRTVTQLAMVNMAQPVPCLFGMCWTKEQVTLKITVTLQLPVGTVDLLLTVTLHRARELLEMGPYSARCPAL